MASTQLEAESQSLSGKETPVKNTEEVLIEREGKFELISASDMQADTDTDLNTPDPQPKFSKTSIDYVSTDPKKTFDSKVQGPGSKGSKDGENISHKDSKYSETWSNPDDQQIDEDAVAKPYTAETSEVTADFFANTDDPFAKTDDTAAKIVTANSSKTEVAADTVPVTANSSKSEVVVTAKSSKSEVVPVTAKSEVAADTVPVTAKSSKSEVAADTVPVTANSSKSEVVVTAKSSKSEVVPVTAKSEVAADTVPVTAKSSKSEVAADTVPVPVTANSSKAEVADTVPVTANSSKAEVTDTVPVTANSSKTKVTANSSKAEVTADILPVTANSEVVGAPKTESSTVKPQVSKITFKEEASSESFTSNSSGSDSTEPQFWNAKRRWQEAQLERKRRNESAYNAWLVKKDNQLAEQRKIERVNRTVVTRNDLLQKMDNCEAAYKAWLKAKNRDIHERLEDRSTKSGNLESTNYSSTLSFKMWLEQKQIQRQKEREIEIKRVKEEAEVAKKITPEDANQAYKRWLHMKNYQSRLETQRRLELQRFYFKQGKRLKESLRARFRGY